MSMQMAALDRRIATLDDVLAHLTPALNVSRQELFNLRSAVRTFCRVVDREPRFVPIAAAQFRRTVQTASPGTNGLSPSRWRNVTSGVRRAIRMSGLSTEERPVPLTPAWDALAGRGADATICSSLRRFARFCCARQIVPELVTDETVTGYYDHLEHAALSKSPARNVDDLIRFWNRHVAGDDIAFLARVSRSTAYSLGWTDLPNSLSADAQAFADACRKPDLFSDDAPRAARPSTVYARDRLLRRIISAEIKSGVDREDLKTLADVVRPNRIKLALTFFLERRNASQSVQAALAADLALTIAKRWAKLPDADCNQLRTWALKLRRRPNGLTEKNRERLRQFSDADVVRRFALLPELIAAAPRRQPVNSRTALRLQTALAMSILLAAPIRIGNLVRLDRNRHFHWSTDLSGRRRLHLVIPAAEVKNSVDLEFPLPDQTTTLLERFMAEYQPLLSSGHPSSLLFPGRQGTAKRDHSLRRQLTDMIRKELGIHFNPHLIRHLAAKLYLERYPGHYEDVRRLLGQKSLATTIQSYAGMEAAPAVDRFDTLIAEVRTRHNEQHSRRSVRAAERPAQ